MKPSKLDKEQILKVLKATAYVSLSALITYLIGATNDNPALFGAFTIVINTLLVFVKQWFTPIK